MGKLSALLSGIRRRWLVNSLTLSVVMALIGIAGYSIAMSEYYHTSVRNTLESRATATANYFSRYITTSYNEYYASAVRFTNDFQDRDLLELQFIDTHGRVVISASGLTVGYVPVTGDIGSTLTGGKVSAWTGIDGLTGENVLSVSAPLVFKGQEIIGVLRYVTSLREVSRRIALSLVPAVVIGVLLVAFTAMTNLIFIRSIVHPIREVTVMAKKIAGGSYGVKIEKIYDDEIGELVETINGMSSEIASAEKQKTDFMSSVSHELRTPLTAIAGWGEVLLTSDRYEPDEVRQGLRIILKETTRLSKLVEELLDYTRMESGRMVMLMEPFDLAAELEEIVFMYMNNPDGTTINYRAVDDVPEIVGDRSRIRQVVLNIIDNARKYGKTAAAEQLVDVILTADEREAAVTIRDYGQGIPPEELPLVKRKFYRGTTKVRGMGIGLALCDEIVRMHDGHLEIESDYGHGTMVTIRLPARVV
ncbi:sensor histidine kinase [Clostridia bacterium]|nr:sensor histidine kinase [Clostridia bacterium]